MTLIKNIIVAFSIYSKIPMPIFEWKEKDMKHNIVFLPLVGALIGALSYGVYWLLKYVNAPILLTVCILALIPIIVTGGFHIDGFIDVRDALSSYADKEKKLEILKDPHVGAFAVIHFAALGLMWVGSLSIIGIETTFDFVLIYSVVFFLGRSVSGAFSLKLKKAKKDGMLNMETKSTTGLDFVILVIESLMGICALAFISPVVAAIAVADIVLFSVYYIRMVYKNFGGVTGDLSGFYIVSIEAIILLTVAVACLCV